MKDGVCIQNRNDIIFGKIFPGRFPQSNDVETLLVFGEKLLETI